MRVTESMRPAWETMKRLLFRPFNIGTWFSFGFIFFLQSCMEGGGTNGLNIPRGGGGGGGGSGGSGGDTGNRIGAIAHDVATSLVSALSSLMSLRPSGSRGASGLDPAVVVLVVAISCVVAVPIVILVYWLGTRGQMMAIRAVATGQGGIGEQWNATREAGGMLFKFNLAIAGISLLLLLPLGAVGALLVFPAINEGKTFESMLPLILGLGLAALLIFLPFMLVGAMARNFVAPIMLKHGIGAREGWKRFWAVGREHVGSIIGFYVMRFLVGLLAGVVGLIAGLLTCCLGLLPILHQTVMAPYYVFERAWTLEVLASMSSDFDLRSGIAAAPVDPYAGGGGGGGAYNPYAGGPADNPYAPPGYGGGGQGNPPPGGFGAP